MVSTGPLLLPVDSTLRFQHVVRDPNEPSEAQTERIRKEGFVGLPWYQTADPAAVKPPL